MVRNILRRTPLLALGVLLLPGAAVAQVTGEQVAQMADAERSNLPPSTFGGELGFNGLGGDYFLTLALRLNFDQSNWGFGLQVPLRLRLIDNDPQNDLDYGGILRREDWDEPSDWLRVLRYVYLGQWDKKGPYYVRLGELSGLTVGHGTIMHRYFNGIDPSKWRTGVNVAVNIDAYGGEAMVNDLADPYLVGARFTVRPLMVAMGEGEEEAWLTKKLVLGASIFADGKAPFELGTETVQVPNPDAPDSPITTTRIRNDEHGRPLVTRERALVFLGVDVGLELLSTDFFSITPYTDLNKMSQVSGGWGWHAGVLWNLRVPLAIDTLTVDLRTEYRRVAGDYLAPYFNTVYEIERYQRLQPGSSAASVTKLRSLCGDLECNGNGVPGRNGVFLELLAGLPNFAVVGGDYTAYSGDNQDGTLRLTLEVPALQVVKFSAFYYRVNVAGLNDLFKLDDKSAIVAQASVPLYTVFSINARWWRVWQATPDGIGYESVDDYSIGVGLSLEL
jgi:hypothetical protein